MIHRKELEDAINDNGGDYQGNLTRDVTHLIAKEPLGAKYNYAGQWGIRVVAVEWLEQCLERGMILDESTFQLSVPPEQRGRGAWIRRSDSNISLGKRKREDEIMPQNTRKLRRTASTRLSSQNVGLWSELVGAPVKAEEVETEAWDEQPKETEVHQVAKVTQPMSDSEDVRIGPTANSARPTLKRSLCKFGLGSFLGKPLESERLFQGRYLSLRGFDEKKVRDAM